MADVKLGSKTFNGVTAIKLDTINDGEVIFPNYVVGSPYEITLAASGWSNHYQQIYLKDYTYDAYGVQLGLPAAGSSANAERCIEAGLTISSIKTGYNEDNSYYYTYIYISAVENPTEDIVVSLFGLRSTV